MKLEFVESLIELVERSQVLELEYSEGDCRVRLGLRALPAPPAVSRQAPVSVTRGDAASETLLAMPEAAAASSGYPVSSSLVGIFYRSPSPDKPPFVEVGDAVEEGQTLAIVEAMKMLNPIEADRAGRVSAILKSDGQMIEAGCTLFLIEAVN
ncbi:acetyl-CoA carboxylase biotin carboxyl carrier protein [Pseudomonas sp. MWU13-2105]|uniref:acetyl-CoA carboxylase biotin carboxyl carrier protein n=1 Tax=Pseudomonas sp. MWU13-2105 TaxID=2935074 RepID=UPI002010810F|nr:acetyl-CoA carboxylase biotin carboxyl carrier protein [Pseudomonas sp. MWU13-2105]